MLYISHRGGHTGPAVVHCSSFLQQSQGEDAALHNVPFISVSSPPLLWPHVRICNMCVIAHMEPERTLLCSLLKGLHPSTQSSLHTNVLE